MNIFKYRSSYVSLGLRHVPRRGGRSGGRGQRCLQSCRSSINSTSQYILPCNLQSVHAAPVPCPSEKRARWTPSLGPDRMTFGFGVLVEGLGIELVDWAGLFGVRLDLTRFSGARCWVGAFAEASLAKESLLLASSSALAATSDIGYYTSL